jgi:hypothetical protein
MKVTVCPSLLKCAAKSKGVPMFLLPNDVSKHPTDIDDLHQRSSSMVGLLGNGAWNLTNRIRRVYVSYPDMEKFLLQANA